MVVKDKILVKLMEEEEKTARINIDSRILKYDKLMKCFEKRKVVIDKIPEEYEETFLKIIKFIEYLQSHRSVLQVVETGNAIKVPLFSTRMYCVYSLHKKVDYTQYMCAKGLLNLLYHNKFGEFFSVDSINLIIDYIKDNYKNFQFVDPYENFHPETDYQ